MQGQGLYSVRVFRGRSAVRQFCLHAVGAVMAMCGADQLLKLWSIGVGAGVPMCQSFTAHHGAVSGGFVGVQKALGMQQSMRSINDFGIIGSGAQCLNGFGAGLATCGTDQLLKVYSVRGGAGVPMCRSCIAHHGTVSDG